MTGHVERMSRARIPERALDTKTTGNRCRGRLRKRWIDNTEDSDGKESCSTEAQNRLMTDRRGWRFIQPQCRLCRWSRARKKIGRRKKEEKKKKEKEEKRERRKRKSDGGGGSSSSSSSRRVHSHRRLFVVESDGFDVYFAGIWSDAEHGSVLGFGQRREGVLDGAVESEVAVPRPHAYHRRAGRHVLRNTHLPC